MSSIRRHGIDLHRFIRFAAVGAINTAVSYAVYLGLIAAIGYMWAYVAAFAIGVAVSFLLSSRWVFGVRATAAQAALFPLVYAPQLLLGSVVLGAAVEGFGVHPKIALLFVIALTLPLNFLLAKLILRRRTAIAEP